MVAAKFAALAVATLKATGAEGAFFQTDIDVTNTGDTDLTNLVVTDPLATGCEATFATLLIGASETVTCDVTAVAADFTNVATVTADTPLGTQVSDSDDALVDVVGPGVQIEKTPDSQQVHSGDDVTFTITVTNNGDQDLVDLTVTDVLTPACDTTIAALAVGESTSYDCTATGVTDDFTNIAAVAGTDALGNATPLSGQRVWRDPAAADEDVAEAVYFIATRPEHVLIPDLVVVPKSEQQIP